MSLLAYKIESENNQRILQFKGMYKIIALVCQLVPARPQSSDTRFSVRRLNQEKMKNEVALLQRQLEAKERKMQELTKKTGSMPALKEHYDRILTDLESQCDTLVAERKALMEVCLQRTARFGALVCYR